MTFPVSVPRQCMWSSDGRDGPPCTQTAAPGAIFCTKHQAQLPDQSEWLAEVAQWQDEFR